MESEQEPEQELKLGRSRSCAGAVADVLLRLNANELAEAGGGTEALTWVN